MKALLLIDIQNDYFANGKNTLVDSLQAAQNAKLILNDFRSKGLPVIHIQHLSTRADATFFIPNTEGCQIHKLVQPIENEKVIIKNFPNSFRQTELLETLSSQNISDLVIAGMMTQMCVDATVRAAKDLGFNCTLISDACATKDLQIHGKSVAANEVQKAFLAALSYFYANVITTENYLKL